MRYWPSQAVLSKGLIVSVGAVSGYVSVEKNVVRIRRTFGRMIRPCHSNSGLSCML
jgi:hypothetical protein